MIERRFFKAGADLRADSMGDELSVIGYAAKFNSFSDDLGGFRETILPGAFARSLQSDRDVKFLFNHSPDLILGRKKNGTLSVNEDSTGLRFRCSIANTSVGRDVYRLIQRGDIDSCSFAFQVDSSEPGDPGETWDEIDDFETNSRIGLRTISRANLFDCSAVANPAYGGTSVSATNSMQLNSLNRDMSFLFPEGIPRSFSPEIRSKILRHTTNRFNSKQQIMNLILSS